MRSETENQILDMTVRQLWEKETDDYVRYLRDSTSDTDAAKLHEFYRAAADLYKERASYYRTAARYYRDERNKTERWMCQERQ